MNVQQRADQLAERLAGQLTTPVLRSFRNDHRVNLARFYEQDMLDGDEGTAWAMLSTGETSFLHACYDLTRIGRVAGDFDEHLSRSLGEALIELGTRLMVDERDAEAEARDAAVYDLTEWAGF